jgi:hypothetical protein
MKKPLTVLSVLFGAVLVLVGAGFVFMYVWEAIVVRSGEPDQSLLFWYLPILFLGIFGAVAGVGLLIRGVGRLR